MLHDLFRKTQLISKLLGICFLSLLLITCGDTGSGEKTDPAPAPAPGPTPQYELSVTRTGNGSVTSAASGIACGNDCSESYESGTSVELTATPASGFSFSGWGGSCSGSGSCQVTMTGDTDVSATFVTTSGALSIDDMGMHEVSHGDTFYFQPAISGRADICRVDMGHDDVRVDSETGAISWDTSKLAFGRGFHIRIKCSNAEETAYAAMVVHVDRSGTSRLRVAGVAGISPYIGIAGQGMNSGDTIVFPDGLYPVSVSRDESYENAFKITAPTDGTATQFSTIIAESPGGVVISGAAHGNIPKQKNAFQFSEVNYVAVVGFIIEDVMRSSVTTSGPGNHLLLDFIGAKGAGTWGYPCSNFSEAAAGQCSNAGMRVNGGTPLFQNCYDWGHNRYGIMTRSTEGSITRRSFVRLDEHKGDQPYGGFSNYCDTAHLSQDNTVFDSLAIAAPHYKNYAGLEAYPATGCENDPATLKTEGLLAVNNALSLSLMDQKAGPNHIWDHIVSYDSKGTCTPQSNLCGSLLLQADKLTEVSNAYFGKTVPFNNSTPRAAFGGVDIDLKSSVILEDIYGEIDTGTPPRYLPESLRYFRGRSDTFYGDAGSDEVTTTRRFPIGGEDIIAARMRAYDNPNALSVGGGTVHINGNRGAVAEGESMSEYFWGYTEPFVPPLVVRVKDKGSYQRISWEPLSGSRKDAVTGWKVVCAGSQGTVLATLPKDQLVYHDETGSCGEYGVIALYTGGESGIAYGESAERTSQNYTEAEAPFQLPEIGNNASGITWHSDLNAYLVVQNNAARIYKYDENWNYQGVIVKSGNINNDMEGLAYVENNRVMVVTEANFAHKVVIDETTTGINGNYDVSPGFRLLPYAVSNKGLEGVAVMAGSGANPTRIYACQEGTGSNPTSDMRVVYFDLPDVDPTELLSYDTNLTVTEPFNAETAFQGVITDCAGMTYDPSTGNLIILSQERAKAIWVNPSTGAITGELSLEGAPQYEGVTIGPNGALVFVSEPNWIHIFEK